MKVPKIPQKYPFWGRKFPIFPHFPYGIGNGSEGFFGDH